jgi:hypothetical protein
VGDDGAGDGDIPQAGIDADVAVGACDAGGDRGGADVAYATGNEGHVAKAAAVSVIGDTGRDIAEVDSARAGG